MPQHTGPSRACGSDTGYALSSQVNYHVRRVNEKCLKANLDSKFGWYRIAIDDVVAGAVLVEWLRVEKGVDGVGGALREVDGRCAAVDNHLDLR